MYKELVAFEEVKFSLFEKSYKKKSIFSQEFELYS